MPLPDLLVAVALQQLLEQLKAPLQYHFQALKAGYLTLLQIFLVVIVL